MKKIYDELRYYWQSRQRGLFALSLLLIITIVGSLIAISVWLLEKIGTFITLKFDTIMTVVTVAIVVIYMWNSKREERQAKILEMREQQAEQTAEVERVVAENSYAIIRKCLFTVLSELASVIGLVKPTTLSEMDSPSRIIPRKGFMLCQLVAMKMSSEVDLKLIKESLQMRIGQKLLAGEFEDLRERSHVYNGRAYSVLYIDEITDTGGYIQINLTLVNDAYCQYLENKAYAKQQNMMQSPTLPRDTDF